jgi:hypothetical protein
VPSQSFSRRSRRSQADPTARPTRNRRGRCRESGRSRRPLPLGAPIRRARERPLSCGWDRHGRTSPKGFREFRSARYDAAFRESRYTTATYNDYSYDARHVLTFLTDLLSCYPRGIRLGWCGVRRDMFELARQAWRHLRFCRPIAVDAASAPRLITGPPDPAQVRILCRSAWLDSADLYAFEFGRASDGEFAAHPKSRPPELSPEDADALSSVRSGFATVMHEHTRLSADPNAGLRRFVGIKRIHNDNEPLFATHIAVAATPFSSRLRHGFVVSATPELATEPSARLLIGRCSGAARRSVRKNSRAPAISSARCWRIARSHRTWCIAPLSMPRSAGPLSQWSGNPSHDGRLPVGAQRALARLEEARPAVELGPPLGVIVADGPLEKPGERPLGRFAKYEDWDDRAWSTFAIPYAVDPRAKDAFSRCAARWEQVHLLYGLDRADKLIGAVRVLIVATMSDPAIAAISWRVGRLDVAGAGDCGGTGASSPAFWRAGAPYRPIELKILAAGTRLQQLEPRAYNVVVFPHGAMFAAGFDSALDSMASAERLLRRDGGLVFKAEIAAGAVPHPKFFDAGLHGKNGLTARLTAFTERITDGGFDPRLSRSTVDRTWPQDGPRPGEAYFRTLQDGRILIPSFWFLRRRETAGRRNGETCAAGCSSVGSANRSNTCMSAPPVNATPRAVSKPSLVAKGMCFLVPTSLCRAAGTVSACACE